MVKLSVLLLCICALLGKAISEKLMIFTVTGGMGRGWGGSTVPSQKMFDLFVCENEVF